MKIHWENLGFPMPNDQPVCFRGQQMMYRQRLFMETSPKLIGGFHSAKPGEIGDINLKKCSTECGRCGDFNKSDLMKMSMHVN